MPIKKSQTRGHKRLHQKRRTRRIFAVKRGGASQGSQGSQETWHTSPSPQLLSSKWYESKEEVFKSQMHNLIATDSVKEFEKELDKKLKDIPFLELATIPGGVTLLMQAASSSSFETFMYLIKKGADIFTIDDGGRTPLIYAVEYHSEKGTQEENETNALARVQLILSELVKAVNAVNIRTKRQKEAIKMNQQYIDHMDNNDNNALSFAILMRYPKVVEALCEFGAKLGGPYKKNSTSLMLACEVEDKDMQFKIAMILLKTAMKRIVTPEDFPFFQGKLTPGRLSRYVGRELDGFINAMDEYGRIALGLLCANPVINIDLVKVLLRLGSNIDANGPLYEICFQNGENAYMVCKLLLVEYLHRKDKFMEITAETIDTQSEDVLKEMGNTLKEYILYDIVIREPNGQEDHFTPMEKAENYNRKIFELFQKIVD